jgi:hypothetical protein
VYGIKNNVPESVRLGEKMMSAIGETLPREMQVAVKAYMADNNKKY